MHRIIYPIIMLLLIAGLLLVKPTPGESADTKVHRKSASQEVELYVTDWCPYCQQAKSFLNSKGIDYQLYDIEKDAAAARRKQQLDPGRGVPFAVINGIKISGWSRKAYETALEN